MPYCDKPTSILRTEPRAKIYRYIFSVGNQNLSYRVHKKIYLLNVNVNNYEENFTQTLWLAPGADTMFTLKNMFFAFLLHDCMLRIHH